jgi:hypothetical protein
MTWLVPSSLITSAYLEDPSKASGDVLGYKAFQVIALEIHKMPKTSNMNTVLQPKNGNWRWLGDIEQDCATLIMTQHQLKKCKN